MRKHDPIRVLTILGGAMTVLDIANPRLKKAFPLEVCRGKYPHERTEELSLFFLAMLKPVFFSLSCSFRVGDLTAL